MTGSNDIKPILVIGIGNPLLSDDGVGLQLLEEISNEYDSEKVEFLDGGTQGIALLGYLENRKAILFLDAVSKGDNPGDIHELSGEEILNFKNNRSTAHESGAVDILKTSLLTGGIPDQIFIFGIEPEILKTSIGISDIVKDSISEAKKRIIKRLDQLVESIN